MKKLIPLAQYKKLSVSAKKAVTKAAKILSKKRTYKKLKK